MAAPGTDASARLPDRPYLRPWYRIVEEDGRVLLEYGQSVVVLEGAAVPSLLRALLPLLDGTRTIDELATVLGPPVRPAIEHALAILADSRLLEEGPPLDAEATPAERETAELLAALSPDRSTPAAVAAELAAATVGIVGSAVVAADLGRLLLAAGVRHVRRLEWAAPGSGIDLVLVCPAGDELPRLDAWNAQMIRTRGAWLQMLPFDGRMAAVGPLFLWRDGCCQRCYQLRRAATSNYRAEFARLERAPAPFPSPRFVTTIAAGVGAIVALRWLAWRDPLVVSRLFAVELGSSVDVTVHHVYRVPRCPACSGLDGVAPPLPWFKEEARAAA